MARLAFVWIAGLALVSAVFTTPAAAAECPVHIVRSGETLRIIAERYLGNRDRSGRIYRLNRGRIGANPNLIEPGMRLRIPCARAAPEIAIEEPPPTPPKTIETTVEVETAPITGDPLAQRPAVGIGDPSVAVTVSVPGLNAPSVGAAPVFLGRPAPALAGPVDVSAGIIYALAGGPMAPFVDANARGGGLAVELMQAALAQVEDASAQVEIVQDRPAHLDFLLPKSAFSLSFPWVYPDCAANPTDPVDRQLCADFIASDSLYEQVTEVLVRSDSVYAGAADPIALTGARVCLPEGYPDGLFGTQAMQAAGISILRAKDPVGCIAMIQADTADLTALDATVARAVANQTPITRPMVVLEAFTQVDRLSAVAQRGDPAGTAAIEALNRGLTAIAESGAWFEIVDSFLRDASG
ncbi:MAG: transporter substrate-binding domain-containing protein [Pseudomonadota bacterium]